MKLDTQFNVGDTAYVIRDGKVKLVSVACVVATQNSAGVFIKITVDVCTEDEQVFVDLWSTQVFKSKADAVLSMERVG